MHPLRGLAIVTCTTLFLLGAIGWMLPVSSAASTTTSTTSSVSSTATACGSILRPVSAGASLDPGADARCQDARKFRGLIGAIGMGAGIVGLGLAIGIESSRPSPSAPQLRLITNREMEADVDPHRATKGLGKTGVR